MPETILRARKFNVERGEYEIPGRGMVQRELVVHPGAVLIIPLLDCRNVVMIHNYRFAVGQELIELPAGTLEAGEDPMDCAARELQEETGYRAGRLESMGHFYTSPGFTNEIMHVFTATDLKEGPQELDDGEQIRVEVMPLADVFDACGSGRITDAKTVAALMIYLQRNGGCA